MASIFSRRKSYHTYNNTNNNAPTIVFFTDVDIPYFPYKRILEANKKYKSLRFSRNVRIKRFTSDIEKMDYLKEIEIFADVNKIKNFTIPRSNTLEKIKLVNYVPNDKLGISRILKDIGDKCPNLKYLEVDGYRLSGYTLPREIYNLKNLEKLGIKNAGLNNVTSDISNLTKLEELILSKNSMKSLPNEIVKLTQLKTLDISRNPINVLPKNIGNMKSLRTIKMDKPLIGFSDSILNLNNRLVFKIMRTWIGNYHNVYTPRQAYDRYKREEPLLINNRTQIINSSFMSNGNIREIPENRRAFIDLPSEKYNNGTLRRLYDYNGLMRYMQNRSTGRLSGGNFRRGDIKLLKNVNHRIKRNKN